MKVWGRILLGTSGVSERPRRRKDTTHNSKRSETETPLKTFLGQDRENVIGYYAPVVDRVDTRETLGFISVESRV